MASVATPHVQLSTSSNQLLDFTQKLDIDLLDNVVVCMHAGIGTQVYFQMLYIIEYK